MSGLDTDLAVSTALADPDGLEAAIRAGDIEVALVDRVTGAMRWVSDAWQARFGVAPTLSRHTGPTTARSEMHLPPPGETMMRARSMRRPDGTEQLVGLNLTGYLRSDGREMVAVTVRAEPWSSLSVTDRAEVASVLDGMARGVIDRAIMAPTDAEGDAIGVIDIQIDRFDLVKELVGSLEAERLLGAVQRRIRAVVRADDLVYRLPDERFVVLCNAVHPVVGPEDQAERLRAEVATVAVADGSAALTASIGLAISGPGLRGAEVLDAAEAARSSAQVRGRNRLQRHDDPPSDPADRLEYLRLRFDHAVESDRLSLDYHPIVDVGTGALVGMDASINVRPGVGLAGSELLELAKHPVLGELAARGLLAKFSAESAATEGRTAGLRLSMPVTVEQLTSPAVRADARELAEGPLVDGFIFVVAERDVRSRRDLVGTVAAALPAGVGLAIVAASATSVSTALVDEIGATQVRIRRRSLPDGDLTPLLERLGPGIEVLVSGLDTGDDAASVRGSAGVLGMGRWVGRSSHRQPLTTWLDSIRPT